MSSRTSYPTTPEEFIEVWQTSDSAEEAGKKLGMPREIASARACNYRSLGIPLKFMKRGLRGLNVDNLSDLARSFGDCSKEAHLDALKKKNLLPATPGSTASLMHDLLEKRQQ